MFILDHLLLWFFFLPFVLFELPMMKATKNEDGTNAEWKGKVLVLADALGTHYDFALNIVNILADNGYLVHFLVVRYDKSRKLTPPRDSSVKFIEIDFNNDDYDQHFGGKSPMKDFIGAQIEWDKSRLAADEVTKKFAELVKYNMFTYYKAIITEYEHEGKHMFDWLRDQHYDLGIAEFCITSGPLAVFHRIGLKDYIVTSAAPPLPITLYMLGQKLMSDVPERFSAQKGDGNNVTGIRNNNSHRREMNIEEYDNHIKEFTKVYNEDYKEMYNLVSNKKIKTQVRNEEMPPFGELLRRARFFLVNNHPLARFRVNLSKRIKFIGGLDVENAAISKGISKDMPLPEEYEWIKNEKCVVVFSMGTMIGFTGFTEKYVEALHSAISVHQQCKFLLRVNEQTAKHLQKLDKENSNMKIVVMPKFIPQKEILAQSNVLGFIYHCGQNTFNEVLYAEVPFICIPFFGDQFYNAAVSEYMGIGIWVEHEKFVEQFAEALNQLLGPPPLKRNAKKSEKVAQKENTKSAMKQIILSGQIANLINSDPQIPKFLGIIEKVMREKKSEKRMEYVFPAMEKIEKDSKIAVDENPTAKFSEYFKPIYDKWWKANEKNGGEMKRGKKMPKN